jgi:hypothetical protein
MPHLASRTERLPGAALCGNSSALLVLMTSAWSHGVGTTLEALRAELTALDTALLVVSGETRFYFNPRPAKGPSALPEALEGSALSGLRGARGSAGRRSAADILSLLEPDGRERFRLSGRPRNDVAEALLEALQIARQSVSLPASLRAFSAREVRLFSLVGALNLVLTELTLPEPSAQNVQA